MLEEMLNSYAQNESQLCASIKQFLEEMPLCCIIFDKDCQLLYCNNHAVSLFGLHNEQEVKTRFCEMSPLFQPDGLLSTETMKKNIQYTFTHGKMCFEWIFQNFNCEDIPVHVTLVCTKASDDSFIVCFIKDLSEIKASEAEIRESDKRNYAMFKSLPLSCTFWDKDLKIIDCNNEAIKLFELANKKVYFQRFYELSPEYQPDGRLSREKCMEMVKLAFEKGRIKFEWMHEKLNGEQIPAEVTLVRVKRNKKNIVIGYTRDLRELKETMALLEHLEELAFLDGLTNIYNRRYFVEQAEHILSAHRMQHENISIMMIDIDWFKKINDRYGHLVGDDVLKNAANIIKSELRSEDLLARYGGEEFIVLVKIDSEQAEILAERIRYKISNSYFSYGNSKFRITVSIGLMTRKAKSLSLTDCIGLADNALYEAKRSGRNYVAINSAI